MTWWAGLKAKLGVWLGIAGAVVIAIAAALIEGLRKGRQQQATEDEAREAKADAAAAEQRTAAANTRKEVEDETAKLPDAPAQQVGTADPGTAAGRLRQWTRDQDGD